MPAARGRAVVRVQVLANYAKESVRELVKLMLGGCGYDTNNQNSPNSTQVGTNTANPTP